MVLSTKVPRSVGIIADANRRWAKRRKKGALYGHTRGFRTVLPIIEAAAFKAGVQHVAFFWASEDNFLNRPKEVEHICRLLKEDMRRRLRDPQQVRFRLVGVWERFYKDPVIRRLAKKLQEKTKGFNQKQVTICFGYDGRTEIIEGFKRFIHAGGSIRGLNRDTLDRHLWTGHMPPVDLVIRTGAKKDPHNSAGFLMWKSANAQLRFTKTHWPAFTPRHLKLAFKNFVTRERRLGA